MLAEESEESRALDPAAGGMIDAREEMNLRELRRCAS